jgi:hypothetical protein
VREARQGEGLIIQRIERLQRHLVEVEFDRAVKARWTAQRAYFDLLPAGTPPGEFVARFTIA